MSAPNNLWELLLPTGLFNPLAPWLEALPNHEAIVPKDGLYVTPKSTEVN
jgi:hypothetical protein